MQTNSVENKKKSQEYTNKDQKSAKEEVIILLHDGLLNLFILESRCVFLIDTPYIGSHKTLQILGFYEVISSAGDYFFKKHQIF
jgi:hypothetical protein